MSASYCLCECLAIAGSREYSGYQGERSSQASKIQNDHHASEDDYSEAVDSYMGWCTVCNEFTRECTEGDAEGYDCEVCGQNTVIGAENALIMGLIDFE